MDLLLEQSSRPEMTFLTSALRGCPSDSQWCLSASALVSVTTLGLTGGQIIVMSLCATTICNVENNHSIYKELLNGINLKKHIVTECHHIQMVVVLLLNDIVKHCSG